jgi:hypothetical protein
LNRLGKPAQLYYYPNENHLPDDPKARLATLQRNLDWYRGNTGEWKVPLRKMRFNAILNRFIDCDDDGNLCQALTTIIVKR